MTASNESVREVYRLLYPPLQQSNVDQDERAAYLKASTGGSFRFEWTCHPQYTETSLLWPRIQRISCQAVVSPSCYWSKAEYRNEVVCYFCHTLSGCGVFEDAGGEHLIGPGQCFVTELLDPSTGYHAVAGGDEAWRFLAVDIVGLTALLYARDLARLYGHVFSSDGIQSIIASLLALERAGTNPILSETETLELIMGLFRGLVATGEQGNPGSYRADLVRKSMELMNRYIESDKGIADFARQLGVSHNHLTRVFSSKVGINPATYMKGLRLRHACMLLSQTEAPIAEIARRIGYSSCTNFSHAFRAELDCSPSEFRFRSVVSWDKSILG